MAVDPCCRADEAWYSKNKTQPARDQPWYHVLVHGSQAATYAAQDSLAGDRETEPVNHPLIEKFFSDFRFGRYVRNDRDWPSWPQ